MWERSVTEAEVDEVLREYETDLPARKGRRNRYKVIGNRRIRITFKMRGADEYFVWTVTVNEVVP